MKCRLYKNTCCINESNTEENFNNYCCNDCLIHMVIEHDKLLEEEVKKFDFDIPKKYVRVERTDHMRIGWNECPSCGCSIGYSPKDTEFRCPKCNQRILWE